MSLQACTAFLAAISSDADLQQELTTVLEGKQGIEATYTLVWVGVKHGYEFTIEEAVQKYQEIIATETTELNDTELDQVAGGFGFPLINPVITKIFTNIYFQTSQS